LLVVEPEDAACELMRKQEPGSIPLAVAPVYTKLRILHGLGAITKESFDTCVGGVGFELPGPGFHRWEKGKYTGHPFAKNLQAVIQKRGKRRVFRASAEGQGVGSKDGKTYDGKMVLTIDLGSAEVPLEKVSWPRGAYRIGGGASWQFTSERMDDAIAGMKGWVLIVESSHERIVGSVVMTETLPAKARSKEQPLTIRFAFDKAGAADVSPAEGAGAPTGG
jgi:hypothetical protein